jgi:oleandomycin transport system ATP-binding protein
MEHVIRAEGLKKRFGETQALAGVDILARRGTVVGVLGPNGAGKTTAVRILATLMKPDEGHAEVGGFDVVKDAAQVRQMISLTMIARLIGLSRAESRRRAADLLDRFALSDAAGRATKTYSGGMRRRLDLAAGLVSDPQVTWTSRRPDSTRAPATASGTPYGGW